VRFTVCGNSLGLRGLTLTGGNGKVNILPGGVWSPVLHGIDNIKAVQRGQYAGRTLNVEVFFHYDPSLGGSNVASPAAGQLTDWKLTRDSNGGINGPQYTHC
jgi:hypothetical protein